MTEKFVDGIVVGRTGLDIVPWMKPDGVVGSSPVGHPIGTM
jgi:hypothetical protein